MSSDLEKIEQGVRRTRRSTLERIAGALVKARPELGNADELLERLVVAAGPALAREPRCLPTSKRSPRPSRTSRVSA